MKGLSCQETQLIEDADLVRVARRLFWWEPPASALRHLPRFVAHVMNWGTWEDVRVLQRKLGEGAFETVLDDPPPGVFTPRRWNYWHVRLGRVPVPALPKRTFA